METRCGACGAPFDCNPGPDCWCTQLPQLPMPKGGDGCLCPACLNARLEERKQPAPATTQPT